MADFLFWVQGCSLLSEDHFCVGSLSPMPKHCLFKIMAPITPNSFINLSSCFCSFLPTHLHKVVAFLILYNFVFLPSDFIYAIMHLPGASYHSSVALNLPLFYRPCRTFLCPWQPDFHSVLPCSTLHTTSTEVILPQYLDYKPIISPKADDSDCWGCNPRIISREHAPLNKNSIYSCIDFHMFSP